MTGRGWERVVTTYSVTDIPLATRYALDPGVLLTVSGADRLGDLNPGNVLCFGHLDRDWFCRLQTEDRWDPALAQQLREALRRRQWLWMAEIDATDLARVQDQVGHGLVQAVGPAVDGVVPIAVNPCAVVRAWLGGTAEQQAFMRWATTGTDTLTVSRHDLSALRGAGVEIVERSPLLRFLRSPKVLAYFVVLAYSALRALPVTFVQQFHGRLWVLWAIDLVTAIPYTWGIIAMVAARRRVTRWAGVVVALTTFVLPYVYFWANGRGYPWFVTVVVVGMIVAACALEGWRWLRDHVVARRLRTPREVT